MYEKQGASISLSYNTSQVSSKIISIKVYKLTIFYLQNAEKVLHQGLSARTTHIILIIDYREIILGHEMMSNIIHAI
jgi:hypothetical protein